MRKECKRDMQVTRKEGVRVFVSVSVFVRTKLRKKCSSAKRRYASVFAERARVKKNAWDLGVRE
jgi:hypothetical protein